ncbi:MAG: class I SAM-dependent methyltransferase, partial [Opitutaceae bacterium]
MPRPITEINAQHLDQIRAWHDGQPGRLNWASVGYRAMLAHYYNLLIPSDASVLEIGCGSGELLKRIRAKRKVGIDLSEKQVSRARDACPDGEFRVQAAEELSLEERFDVVVISDTLNFSADVQKVLE